MLKVEDEVAGTGSLDFDGAEGSDHGLLQSFNKLDDLVLLVAFRCSLLQSALGSNTFLTNCPYHILHKTVP